MAVILGSAKHPANAELLREHYLRKEQAFLESKEDGDREYFLRKEKARQCSSALPYRIPVAGEAIEVTGMRRHAALNGAKGEIKGSIDGDGFLTVRLQGHMNVSNTGNRTMKVRANCLRPLATSASSPVIAQGGQQSMQHSARRYGSRVLGSGAMGAVAVASLANTSSSFRRFKVADQARAELAEKCYKENLSWYLEKMQGESFTY